MRAARPRHGEHEKAVLPGAVVGAVIARRIALVHVDIVNAVTAGVLGAECVNSAVLVGYRLV